MGVKAAGVLILLPVLCACKPPAAPRHSMPEERVPAARRDPQPAFAAPIRRAEAEVGLREIRTEPTGAQAAATVVETYYALIESRRYDDARKLRWDYDRLASAEFAASFAPYAEYRATVGTPSQIASAAGSLYVEVPVQLYGRLRSGKAFGTVGTITLRRLNGIPGSTPEQRHWRIYAGE